MKIHIRKIRSEGIEYNEDFSQEWIDLTRKDSIRFIQPIKVKAMVIRAGDEIFVKVTANSQYESFCYRCLNDLKRDWNAHFTLIFDIERKKEFIEIEDDIRQELILNLPTRILCRNDCKGLCIDCGVNLNEKECQHKHSIMSGK